MGAGVESVCVRLLCQSHGGHGISNDNSSANNHSSSNDCPGSSNIEPSSTGEPGSSTGRSSSLNNRRISLSWKVRYVPDTLTQSEQSGAGCGGPSVVGDERFGYEWMPKSIGYRPNVGYKSMEKLVEKAQVGQKDQEDVGFGDKSSVAAEVDPPLVEVPDRENRSPAQKSPVRDESVARRLLNSDSGVDLEGVLGDLHARELARESGPEFRFGLPGTYYVFATALDSSGARSLTQHSIFTLVRPNHDRRDHHVHGSGTGHLHGSSHGNGSIHGNGSNHHIGGQYHSYPYTAGPYPAHTTHGTAHAQTSRPGHGYGYGGDSGGNGSNGGNGSISGRGNGSGQNVGRNQHQGHVSGYGSASS